MHKDLWQLLTRARANEAAFADTVALLHSHYEITPGTFTTGAGTPLETRNPAGTNTSSCALLALASRLCLDPPTTLGLYGEHYRSVRANPQGVEHPNIRAFMANGWAGVRLPEGVLRLRGPGSG